MKSRNRPPLKLTNDEDAAPVEVIGAPADMAESVTDEASPAAEDEVSGVKAAAPPAPAEPERPMSERRRRRLLEEQRQAQQRAEAERMAAEATPEPAAAELAVAAGAPLSPFERTTAPTIRTVQAHGVPAAGRRAYALAALAAVLWIGGVASWAAYEFGINGAGLDPLRLAIYALIALAPAGLALMLAHAVRQGSGLAAETRRAREMAEALVAPTALAAQQTGDVLQSLRSDIDQAALAAERARSDMALLREALSEETLRLNEAAETAGRTARRLAEQLGRERDQMQTLGIHLDTQASGVIDAVERHGLTADDATVTRWRSLRSRLRAEILDIWIDKVLPMGGGIGGRGMMLGRLIEADANKDGVITVEEAVAAATKRFDQLDKNKDGAIDKADFDALRRCGIAAETAMLRATAGINTHRGAVFSLGLLVAAAAACRNRSCCQARGT